MARYLTPARLSLLVLVRAYQAGQTSQESTLGVLEFLARHTTTATEHSYDAVNERNALSSPDIAYLADMLRGWSSCHPGRSLYDVFLLLVWRLDGLDSLHTLVGEQDPETSAIDPRSLTPASPLGQFVRRCYVEYTRMQFDDTHALWDAFAAYREPTREDFQRRHPRDAHDLDLNRESSGVPATLQDKRPRSSAGASLTASVVDADMLLSFAIHHLQKLGTRVPEDVKTRLEKWIDDQWDSGTQSLHFFMAFFEHWRSGQYTMALESLHRYFDYSLAARGNADNMKAYYQYALLHLSVLHADFECWEESVDAMNECIATARENQDSACLNFALSWLLYLRHAHLAKDESSFGTISGIVGSGGGEHDEITFLKQKAKEGKHWMLLSSTLLEEAKLEMYSGGSANRAQEHILQATFLNIQHDLRTLMSAAVLFQGASLDRIGQSHLADRYYEFPHSVHDAHCPLNDRVRATCRIAHKLALTGAFSRSLDLLHDLMPMLQGVLKLEQRVKAFTYLILLRKQIHRNDIEAMNYFLNQLAPVRSGSDPEVVFEINLLEIEAFVKQARFDDALMRLNEHLKELKGGGADLAQRLHFLILKSKVLAAGGIASKGFSIALRATSVAERHLLMPILLEGLTVLSRILIELAEFEMARDIAEAALPQAIKLQNLELTARMYVVAGEACVGFSGHGCDSGSADQARAMRRAQELIEQGRLEYEKLGDLNGTLDCLLMKSKIARWAGDDASAGQAEENYLQLSVDR